MQQLADRREDVDRQQVDRVHQEDPAEHGQREWRDVGEIALDQRVRLLVDHVDEHLDGGLEPPGHARGRTPSREPEHEQHDQAAEHGEEQRVPVDDGEVEQSPRLVVLGGGGGGGRCTRLTHRVRHPHSPSRSPRTHRVTAAHRPRRRVGASARGDAWHLESADSETRHRVRLLSPRCTRRPLKRRESISGPFAVLQIGSSDAARAASREQLAASAAASAPWPTKPSSTILHGKPVHSMD